jgi:EAL domain-containing protein (putative c-di-GMP-specific phosphodiesterase class I)
VTPGCAGAGASPLQSDRVRRVMELARRHLGMQVAFVAEIAGGEQCYRALHGDAASFGLRVGGADRLETTYCNLMLSGTIPSVVRDSQADERLRALEMTTTGGIRAYVGVPLRASDGTLYGTFCCLAKDPEPHLDERDASFLALLAELLAEDVDAQRQREAVLTAISSTIRDERLAIALQPITHLGTGRCLGFEALSRFEIGPPDVVFAQADVAGLGTELERLAVGKAVQLLALLDPEQYLAVNLTPAAAVEVAATVAETPGLPLRQLVLELTEHVSVADYAALRAQLQPLRERGMRLAIDDTGAGFASLHHVVELQPDIIKIDRSLVHGLAANKAQRSIVTGFVLLALDSGASLVAEGVETTDDLAVLDALGVDAAQGYLIARPSTDRADLARWVASADMLAGLV